MRVEARAESRTNRVTFWVLKSFWVSSSKRTRVFRGFFCLRMIGSDSVRSSNFFMSIVRPSF